MQAEERDPEGIEPAGRTHLLVARLRSGENDTFRELYERIAPSLCAWARLRLSPERGTALEPEDLLQEVWLRAIESLASFEPERASFRAWIFGIAKHVAYEAGHRRPAATLLAFASLEMWPDVATSIRSRLARDESVRMLVEHVSTLDPIDRMLLIHCGLEDVPCAEAAVRLGVEADAATKRWQRLRARLREDRFSELLEA